MSVLTQSHIAEQTELRGAEPRGGAAGQVERRGGQRHPPGGRQPR